MGELDQAVSATVCVEHFGEELALGETPVSRVSYHMRTLKEARLIRLSHRRPVRGSTEHFYRLAKAFTVEIRDAVAMDRIAEIISENGSTGKLDVPAYLEVERIVNATGRPTFAPEDQSEGKEG